jgi:ATP-dependent Clp endopeptidase proteolytic subunit ClpP
MKNYCDEDVSNITLKNDLVDTMKLNAYLNERVIFIWEEITDNTSFIVNRMLENMERKDQESNIKDPITIKIDSIGGSVYACLSIISKIEELKNKGYEIITISYGKAMSAGLYIAMCGTKRYAQRYCRFLLHQLQSLEFGYNSVESSERSLQDKKEIWNSMRQIIEEHTEIDDEFLDDVTKYNKDEFFFSDKALELGIIDEIL